MVQTRSGRQLSKSTSGSAEKEEVRVYSQNVCCLPAYVRECNLIYGGGLTLTLVLGATAWVVFLSGAPVPIVWLALVFLVSGVWAPIALGINMAFTLVANVASRACVLVGMGHLYPHSHDYKSERMAELAARLGTDRYDAVLLQEFYGSWYSDLHRRSFVAAMKAQGYGHVALPAACSQLPSTWANSGLAIFSPHPLSNVRNKPFATQSYYDRWTVNRGVLSADMRMPDGRTVQLFSTHFAPPLAVLVPGLPGWVAGMFDVYRTQVQELVQVTQEGRHISSSGKAPAIVGGDFNSPVGGDAYNALSEGLGDTGMTHLTRELLEAGGGVPTANPAEEKLLTGGTRTLQTLDYIFGSGVALEHSEVLPQATSKTAPSPFEFISDHMALSVKCTFGEPAANGQ